MSKDLKDLSTEELMQIAKIKVKDDENVDLPPVKRFVISENIQSGNYKVPSILVYYRYEEWCAAHSQKPLSKIKFYKEFMLYFKRERVTGGKGNCFILDGEGFSSSEIHKIIPVKRKTRKSKNVITEEETP